MAILIAPFSGQLSGALIFRAGSDTTTHYVSDTTLINQSAIISGKGLK
jgi:hypothetical protein